MQRMYYHHQVKTSGKSQAAMWLAARLQHLEARVYGNGFEGRCRAFMRLIEDTE
jgi:hypothetical protein